MANIVFEVEKLSKADKKAYDGMTDYEKQMFEHTWIMIETQKMRLAQQKNASRERAARERKVLAEKERKERTHRLIERGAMLEAYLGDPLEFTNEEVKNILNRTLGTEFSSRIIGSIRARHEAMVDVEAE